MNVLVFGLYNSTRDAKATIDQLKNKGFNRSDIELIEHSKQKEDQGFFKSLFSSNGGGNDLESEDLSEMGLSEADSRFYTQAVKDGCTLLIVQCDEDNTDHADTVLANSRLSDYGLPPSQRKASGGEAPRKRESKPTLRGSSSAQKEHRKSNDSSDMGERPVQSDASGKSKQKEKFEAIEEELHVGKRDVGTGGIRVSTEISEESVEEKIELKREELDIQRHDVDRPADASESAFKEEHYEFTETHEEPVVEKQARVKEEVIVEKNVHTVTETIRENLRRQDIKIEDLYSMADDDSGNYEQFDSDIRSHYDENYAMEENVSDGEFDEYAVGYRYGMSLAEHEPLRQHKWTEVEAIAKEGWEAHNAGTWDTFREPIYFGWVRIRGDEEGTEVPRQQI